MIGYVVIVLYVLYLVLAVLYLLLPFWIFQQVKANHQVMIQGFAECMDALGHLGRRLERIERSAGAPSSAAASGVAASTEPVSTDSDPS